jgi:hypothetical protein
MPQKLSPAARKKKAARDLAYAKTPRRRAMKAETQKKRRDAIKKGVNIKGKDWDHNKGKFVSVKVNRGGYGKGTKKYNTT